MNSFFLSRGWIDEVSEPLEDEKGIIWEELQILKFCVVESHVPIKIPSLDRHVREK